MDSPAIVRWTLPPHLLSVVLAIDCFMYIYVNDRAPRRVQARIIKQARRLLRQTKGERK